MKSCTCGHAVTVHMKRTNHANEFKLVCKMCPCACYTPAQIEQAL